MVVVVEKVVVAKVVVARVAGVVVVVVAIVWDVVVCGCFGRWLWSFVCLEWPEGPLCGGGGVCGG